jgi:hypothetical protein
VQILECSMDDNGAAVVGPYVQRFRPNHPVGWQERTAILTFLQVPIIAPGWVPKMVFIDRQGEIREQHQGEEPFFKDQRASVQGALERLLAVPAPAQKKKRGGKKR